jgi:valacyclovir hydrolase
VPELILPAVTLHYEEAGSGPPLLMLHGGLGTALLHFRRDIPAFAARYRVIAPDLRGYGQSTPPRAFPPDFYERDAADMAALLDALGLAAVHVLGWSDGAMVGQLLAIERPQLVRSLILIGGQSYLMEEERANWPPLVDTAAWSTGAVERFRAAQGPLNWPSIFRRMLDGYNGLLDQGGEITRTRLGEIRCPTLIIHGEADPVVPVAHARTLHEGVAGSELHLWPGVGHLPHHEQAERFQALALDFLARVDASPAR